MYMCTYTRTYVYIDVCIQAFPDGLNNTGVPDKRKVLSGYPGFQWDFVFQGYIPSGYLTFSGPLDGIRSVRKGRLVSAICFLICLLCMC